MFHEVVVIWHCGLFFLFGHSTLFNCVLFLSLSFGLVAFYLVCVKKNITSCNVTDRTHSCYEHSEDFQIKGIKFCVNRCGQTCWWCPQRTCFQIISKDLHYWNSSMGSDWKQKWSCWKRCKNDFKISCILTYV